MTVRIMPRIFGHPLSGRLDEGGATAVLHATLQEYKHSLTGALNLRAEMLARLSENRKHNAKVVEEYTRGFDEETRAFFVAMARLKWEATVASLEDAASCSFWRVRRCPRDYILSGEQACVQPARRECEIRMLEAWWRLPADRDPA